VGNAGRPRAAGRRRRSGEPARLGAGIHAHASRG